MSFIDTIKSVGTFLKGNSIGSNLAKTALYGFALSKLAKSIQKQNDRDNRPDPGRQITLNPDTNNSIPVVYGDVYMKGILTDAYMSDNNKTMWFCLTLSEMTGNKIDGTASEIKFVEVYYNGLRLDFDDNGYSVNTAYDDDNNQTTNFNGLIKIYPFSGGSTNPVGFTTEDNQNSLPAYNLFPSWTTTDTMSGLVFALIQITYSPDNDITGVGDFTFKLSNTMKLPGDVLYDYMRNTRYGAGIPDAEINIS